MRIEPRLGRPEIDRGLVETKPFGGGPAAIGGEIGHGFEIVHALGAQFPRRPAVEADDRGEGVRRRAAPADPRLPPRRAPTGPLPAQTAAASPSVISAREA